MTPHVDARPTAPAGFWIRFVAVVLDAVVLIVFQQGLELIARAFFGAGVVESRLFHAATTTFMLCVGIAYSVVLLTTCGATLGKMALGMRVVDGRGEHPRLGTAVLRYVATVLSGLLLGIGFLMAGLRSDKRALHDLLAGTRVLRR